VKLIIRGFAAAVGGATWSVIAIVLLLSIAFGALAGTIENSDGQEGFSPENDEILAAERIGDLFGESATRSVMQVVVRSGSGDVITAEGVAAVRDAIAAIEASEAGPYVSDSLDQPGVVSFLTPVFAGAAQQELDPAALDDAAVKQTYRQVLDAAGPELGFARQLVPDGVEDRSDVGLMLVFVDTSSDTDVQTDRELAIAEAVRSVAGGPDLELLPFSFLMLFGEQEDFTGELGRLFGSAFAIIVGVLLFVYWLKPRGRTRRGAAIRRTLADTGVTMLTIVLAIVWMNGIGALLQRAGVLGPLTQVAQIVPILLIGLGVDYGIHLTSRFRDEIGEGRTVDDAMRRAIGTVGVALVLATVTTAIGFLTNIVNPIPALRDFGVLAAIGIVASFVLMLTFVPALRLVLDRRAEAGDRLPVEGMGATRERLLPGLVGRTSILAERAPVPTLVVMAALGYLGYLGLANISTEFSFTDFLPEDAPAVITLEILEDRFGGGFGETTQVLLEGELSDPEVFNALVFATERMADTPDVLRVPTPGGDVASVASPASVVRQLLGPAPDGTPPDPEYTAAALAAGLDPQTGRIATDGDVRALFDAARRAAPDTIASVLATDEDGAPVAGLLDIGTQAGDDRALALRDALVSDLEPLGPTGATVVVTSQDIIGAGIVESLSDSQVVSLLITLVAATLVLMLTFWIENRRPFLGVITMLPVALVVLWTFGLMYLSGIPFGPVTATLTGLAVGIGVPYTIHMARRFEEDRGRYADINQAIRETTRNTGGALAGSAFTTAAGFGILVTSTLTPFQQMGLVTSYAILLSLFGAIITLPSLLVLWERWHRRRGDPAVERETVSIA
jgi:uncharacterized protein